MEHTIMKKLLILLVFLISCGFANNSESNNTQHKDTALAKACEPTIYETITTSGIYISNNPFRNLKIDNNGLNDDLKGTIYELPQGRADKQALFKLGKFEMGTHDKIPKVWAYEIRTPQGLLQVSTDYIDFMWSGISDTTIIGLINTLPHFPKATSEGKYYRLSYDTDFAKLAKIDTYGNCKEKLARTKAKEPIDYDQSQYCLAVSEVLPHNLSKIEIIVLIFKPFYTTQDYYENTYKHTKEYPYIAIPDSDFILEKDIALELLIRVYAKVYDTNRKVVEIKPLALYPSVYNVKTKEKCAPAVLLSDVIHSKDKD